MTYISGSLYITIYPRLPCMVAQVAHWTNRGTNASYGGVCISSPELCSTQQRQSHVETENPSIYFFKQKHHGINLSIKHIYILFFVCFLICNKRIITSDRDVRVCMLSLQSCPILCDPMNCSPPGSSVHGILQARILEWVAMSFSRGSSWTRDQTHVSWIALFITSTSWEAPDRDVVKIPSPWTHRSTQNQAWDEGVKPNIIPQASLSEQRAGPGTFSHFTFRVTKYAAETHLSLLLMVQLEHVSLIQALMDELSDDSLSLSSLRPNALMKCHECPFRNYLKLLTSPNLFIWHLSPLLRGTTGCCFPVWLQKCSSDFNTELMLCVNWMFSMLTFKGKHRKQASRGLIGYIKHKLHGTISKAAERSCHKNITSSFDLFFLRTKSDQQKLKIWHSLDSFT